MSHDKLVQVPGGGAGPSRSGTCSNYRTVPGRSLQVQVQGPAWNSSVVTTVYTELMTNKERENVPNCTVSRPAGPRVSLVTNYCPSIRMEQ